MHISGFRRRFIKENYKYYFIPSRVISEFKSEIANDDKINPPILKRKITAMIYATKQSRVKIKDNVYVHKFEEIEITVEEDTKIVSKINNCSKIKNLINFRLYNELCKAYDLNSDHTDFSPDIKDYMINKDISPKL